jgi:hypothetical protein
MAPYIIFANWEGLESTIFALFDSICLVLVAIVFLSLILLINVNFYGFESRCFVTYRMENIFERFLRSGFARKFAKSGFSYQSLICSRI